MSARIPTWRERCERHPDHQTGMIFNAMIQARMGEEINDLRRELKAVRTHATRLSRLYLKLLTKEPTP